MSVTSYEEAEVWAREIMASRQLEILGDDGSNNGLYTSPYLMGDTPRVARENNENRPFGRHNSVTRIEVVTFPNQDFRVLVDDPDRKPWDINGESNEIMLDEPLTAPVLAMVEGFDILGTTRYYTLMYLVE